MKKLTKTLVWAVVGMGIGFLMTKENVDVRPYIMWLMAGFVPGWKAIAKVGLIPMNVVGIILYFILSAFVGLIALPVEIVSGVLEMRREGQFGKR